MSLRHVCVALAANNRVALAGVAANRVAVAANPVAVAVNNRVAVTANNHNRMTNKQTINSLFSSVQ